MESLDPASATAVDVLNSSGVVLPSVAYRAGLTQPFTESSTYNPPEVLGSGIPLGDTRNQTAVSDFIDSYDPASAQALSGISNPPFASAAASTPTPNQSPMSDSSWSAMSALTKFGSSFAILLGIKPVDYTMTDQKTAPNSGLYAVSGTKLAILGIIGAVLVILVLNGRKGE